MRSKQRYISINETYDDNSEHGEQSHYKKLRNFCINISHYVGVLLLLVLFFILPIIVIRRLSSFHFKKPKNYYTYNDCLNNTANLGGYQAPLPHNRLTLLNPQNGLDYDVPVYINYDLNYHSKQIIDAVIIQHGNLRNSYDYFFSGLSVLSSYADTSNILLIATQFFIDNDTCWNNNNEATIIDYRSGITCGYPVWSSEGWKDSHASLSHEQLYSYDIFNMLITHIGNRNAFPNLRTITLFGFSAGGQAILRYSFMPLYIIKNPFTSVRFVVSDPSTFLYLNKERPFSNDSKGFGIPDASYIRDNWQKPSKDWVIKWENLDCQSYNNWRFGLDRLNGYIEYYFVKLNNGIANLINEFQFRDITYLIGTADDVNCNLSNSTNCDDNELATYCQAMLQGINRVDRMLKWVDYLKYFYGHAVHHIATADLVPHDGVAMMHSPMGKCVIFGLCDDL